MKIALDYDRCYNVDPDAWDEFICLFESRGHEVIIVTARSQTKDNIDDRVLHGIDIIYCDGVAKKWFCHHHADTDFDVWIDDKPEGIISNSTATKEVLEKWRASEEWSR